MPFIEAKSNFHNVSSVLGKAVGLGSAVTTAGRFEDVSADAESTAKADATMEDISMQRQSAKHKPLVKVRFFI